MKKALYLLFLTPLMLGCGDDSGPVEVSEVRESSGNSAGPTAIGMSTGQRLGIGGTGASASAPAAAPADSGYTWDTPPGWNAGPTSQFRQVADFTFASNPALDCYVSKAGGGVDANVNRWRGQMGLAPLDPAAIAALPHLEVLGESAVYVDIEGTFSGMGGQAPQDDMRMLGVILAQEPQALFIKLVGPKDAVEAEKANFEAFSTSLSEGGGATQASAASQSGGVTDPHAGLGIPSAAGVAATAAEPAEYHWTVPTGWTEAPVTSSFRMATLTVGNSECSLFKFGGAAGGGDLDSNIGMWLGQMSKDPETEQDAAVKDTFTMLGAEATLVRINGEFSAKTWESAEDSMLVAYCPVADGTVFVKFVGPSAEVTAQEAAFRQFCESLHPAH